MLVAVNQSVIRHADSPKKAARIGFIFKTIANSDFTDNPMPLTLTAYDQSL